VFADKLSGKTADWPELAACLDYLRAGDTLVVPSLDRLSRSLQDLITLVAGLRRRGVGFRSLHEALDNHHPGGRLVFHVFAALAEFIRELIVEGTAKPGRRPRPRPAPRRPPAMTGEQIRQARDLLTLPATASPASPASLASAAPPSTSTCRTPRTGTTGSRQSPVSSRLPARLAITRRR